MPVSPAPIKSMRFSGWKRPPSKVIVTPNIGSAGAGKGKNVRPCPALVLSGWPPLSSNLSALRPCPGKRIPSQEARFPISVPPRGLKHRSSAAAGAGAYLAGEQVPQIRRQGRYLPRAGRRPGFHEAGQLSLQQTDEVAREHSGRPWLLLQSQAQPELASCSRRGEPKAVRQSLRGGEAQRIAGASWRCCWDSARRNASLALKQYRLAATTNRQFNIVWVPMQMG